MPVSPAVDTIAASIQLAVAPVFLLTGIGSILNVLASRLGRVTDRARKLESEIGGYPSERRRVALQDLAALNKRMGAAHWAIALCTFSALLVCLVVAILFVGELVPIRGAAIVPWLFIAAMGLLTAGLTLFLYEIQIAMRSVRFRAQVLTEGIGD
ncbi:hypothetical protein GCM10011529_23940 [Polymorphobacter glacialis]|uniref:DUF2721 domain-containing protein n=1 Tax=Sandarakinorhabdus glacialis TaxID=1614636 RepID=A0A916ZW67_9SPHN|nr:DUF2721 domain-containing protein [Polymorphobacter glacialis]GGE16698.1 hypothetical protein GCM10011529_23940 [Polymorphobacter glacialis]